LTAHASSYCTTADVKAGPSGVCGCANGLFTSKSCTTTAKKHCTVKSKDDAMPAAKRAFCDYVSNVTSLANFTGVSAIALTASDPQADANVATYLADTCYPETALADAQPCACYDVSLRI